MQPRKRELKRESLSLPTLRSTIRSTKARLKDSLMLREKPRKKATSSLNQNPRSLLSSELEGK
jgi:hypothetical protein